MKFFCVSYNGIDSPYAYRFDGLSMLETITKGNAQDNYRRISLRDLDHECCLRSHGPPVYTIVGLDNEAQDYLEHGGIPHFKRAKR